MPRRPSLGSLALFTAVVLTFGVPIVRDGLTGGARSAAVLSARSDPSLSASPEPSPSATDPGMGQGAGDPGSPGTTLPPT
ncbi:MAG TPA: hypothetical protein VK656_05540, partial [Candidatus Acidoferrum sp.]|nr:hypothetical protein [Candidatus Acidoferrum sp.]